MLGLYILRCAGKGDKVCGRKNVLKGGSFPPVLIRSHAHFPIQTPTIFPINLYF